MTKAKKKPTGASRKRTSARKKAGKPQVHKTQHPTPREARLKLKRDIEDKREAIRLKQLANHM